MQGHVLCYIEFKWLAVVRQPKQLCEHTALVHCLVLVVYSQPFSGVSVEGGGRGGGGGEVRVKLY